MNQPTLQELSSALQHTLPGRGAHVGAPSSARASTLMVLTDCATLAAVLGMVLAIRAFYGDIGLPIREWIPVFTAIIVTNVVASAWRGIYPGYGVCASALLRSTFYTLTGVFVGVIALSLLTTGSLPYIRSIMVRDGSLTLTRARPRQMVFNPNNAFSLTVRSRKPMPPIFGSRSRGRRVVDTSTMRKTCSVSAQCSAALHPQI